jgi:hypothetical protein
VKFETAFQRAFGRYPTRSEVEEVERICDAFGMQDNDALKHIAALLGFYHAHLRLYPGQCLTGVQQWFGSPEGCAALGKALRAASSSTEGGSSTEPRPAPAFPPPLPSAVSDARHWVTLGGLATASNAFSGALGMLVGAALSGRQPCWVPRYGTDLITIALVGAPMGWVVLLSLIVPAYLGASWGWRCGVDLRRSLGERGIGWAACGSIAIFVMAWATLITRYLLNG